MTEFFDPATSSVRVNKLCREINDVLSFTGNPDLTRLVELATEMRHEAQLIRLWAFEREIHERSNAG
jgi:hypothetical protein